MATARVEIPEELNAISQRIIGGAIEVHRVLGPGLLEKLYEEALVHELILNGLRVQRQHAIRLVYKGRELIGQRLDLVVESLVVVELKSVVDIPEVYLSTLLGYLRAGEYPLGLLINFNVPVLVKGVHRRVNSRALVRLSSSGPVHSSVSSA